MDWVAVDMMISPKCWKGLGLVSIAKGVLWDVTFWGITAVSPTKVQQK